MSKFAFAILICCINAIFAIRPEWYPENASEIESKCMEKHSISPESMSKLRLLEIEEIPAMCPFIFCLLENKNIYRPAVGFEVDRLQLSLLEAIKLDCKEDLIRDCGDKYKELPSADLMYYNILKCIADQKEEHCKFVD